MSVLDLPALDGRTPLGFLSALGLVRLLDVFTDDSPKVSWSRETFTAQLHTRRSSIDEVVGGLLGVLGSIPPTGVLPAAPIDLPPPGAAPDGLRLRPKELRDLAESYSNDPDPLIEEWLTSLVTDLSLDDKGRADISLMAAPSGKQSMRTMLEKPLELVQKHPSFLKDALIEWRRQSGVSGEYLDHRVLFDAADASDGKSNERGVPGATWLALMSYPLLRTTAITTDPITSGWHRVKRSVTFVYPLWSQPLDRYAAVALLEHPMMTRCIDGQLPASAAAMGVFYVGRARRRRIEGRTFAGVLAPLT